MIETHPEVGLIYAPKRAATVVRTFRSLYARTDERKLVLSIEQIAMKDDRSVVTIKQQSSEVYSRFGVDGRTGLCASLRDSPRRQTIGRWHQYVRVAPKAATAAGVFYAASTHIEELGKERVHPVFLLDEAHLLHQDVLDHLRILLSCQWDTRQRDAVERVLVGRLPIA